MRPQFLAVASGLRRGFSSSAQRLSPNGTKGFYSLFPLTFPNGGPPKASFTVDSPALRREFLQLQTQYHPDKLGQLSEDDPRRTKVEQTSSVLNTAYRTLLDPLLRAEHILKEHGIDALAEKESLVDEDLLLDVLMVREALSEVSTEKELEEIESDNEAKIKASVDALEQAFSQGDMEAAKAETVKLSYWMNIRKHVRDLRG